MSLSRLHPAVDHAVYASHEETTENRKQSLSMSKFFDFYDPLEKRYVFNSFLVVVALVEVLILVFTLIWKIDFDGIFLEQVRPTVPFPWKEYLWAAFTAPIALVFLFSLVVRGFELISREEASSVQDGEGPAKSRKRGIRRYLWVVLALLAGLIPLWGASGFAHITNAVKALGLWGSYLLIALFALALLYFPLRLLLRYQLQKKALEYQYLLTLAERYGVVPVDRELPSRLVGGGEKKIFFPAVPASLPTPAESPEEPDSK